MFVFRCSGFRYYRHYPVYSVMYDTNAIIAKTKLLKVVLIVTLVVRPSYKLPILITFKLKLPTHFSTPHPGHCKA